MKRLLIIICCVYISLPVNLFSHKLDVSNDYSPQNILQFSRYLAKHNDYYRSYLELLRLNSYYPDYFSPKAFCISKNYLLFKGSQYKKILDNNNLIEGVNCNSNPSYLIFIFDSYLMLGEFTSASNIIITQHYSIDSPYYDFLFKRTLVSYIISGEQAKLDKYLSEYQSERFSKYREIAQTAPVQMKTQKSPALAFFCGIVPGMGYVYSGRVKTGLVALLFISINAVATYYAFQTGNKSTGLILGAIGTFFYSGSIVGGYMQTKKYNKFVDVYNSNLLFDEFQLGDDQYLINKKYGVGYER